MSARGTWLTLGGIMVLVAALVLLTQPAPSSPDHSSDSDAVDGTSALRTYAGSLGHPVTVLRSRFDPSGQAMMFVFTPDTPYTDGEVTRLHDWVLAGGVLVYADAAGASPQLDAAFQVGREDAQGGAPLTAPGPLLPGVRAVTGALTVNALAPSLTQVPILQTSSGEVAAYTEALGTGRVYVLVDPLPLCNGYLGKADNGRLTADLISAAPPGASIAIDEFHHVAAAAGEGGNAWVRTPWGAAMIWAVAILFVAMALRGRAFGPQVPAAPRPGPTSATYLAAVAGLLRRARARRLTLGLLVGAARAAAARRIGVRPGVDAARLHTELETRAPELAAELAAAEAAAEQADSSEKALLEAARRLQAITNPGTDQGRSR